MRSHYRDSQGFVKSQDHLLIGRHDLRLCAFLFGRQTSAPYLAREAQLASKVSKEENAGVSQPMATMAMKASRPWQKSPVK